MIVEIAFFVFAIIAVLSALLVITQRNPIISALFLIVTFFSLSWIYLLLHAQFIAVMQVLVYAGAVMVLFLFVIMLLNLGVRQQFREKWTITRVLGFLLALVSFELEVSYFIRTDLGRALPLQQLGTTESVGKALFGNYLFPFEITSVLLLVAIIGAVILAKREI